MNWVIVVTYKDHDYYLCIKDYSDKIIAEGLPWDSSVRKLLKKTEEGPDWFINKANETYVWDINHNILKLGDWGWAALLEGGCVEDWSDCYNLNQNDHNS